MTKINTLGGGIATLFFFLPHLWDLSFLTRGQTWVLGNEIMES